MSERGFINTNNLPQAVIAWRLSKADPAGTARVYDYVTDDAVTLHYVAVDSVLTDAQIEAGLANSITAGEEAAIARYHEARSEAALTEALRTLTPAQAVKYVEDNVTTLASAKAVLKIIVRLLIALTNRIYPDLPND